LGARVADIVRLPIHTTRLLLRRLVPADQEDLLELMFDESAFRYIDWEPLDEAEVMEWLRRDQHARLTQPGEGLSLAVDFQNDQKLIGFISVSLTDEGRKQGAFSLMINRQYCQKGFGVEVLRGALELAFSNLNLHRVAVTCDTRNIAACKLLERVGMRQEGKFIEDQFLKNEWVSTFYYALLRKEFLGR
jgi:RimJ/RimL family protein N-acetyltransferase